MLNTHLNYQIPIKAKRFVSTAALAFLLVAGVGLGAAYTSASSATTITNKAAKADRAVTYSMPEDYLDVTLAPAPGSGSDDPLDSELSIWVGEVELNNEKQIWVELIDDHGEVVYDSRINENETHLLPDGRALVVTVMQVEVPLAKTAPTVAKDQARLQTNAEKVVVTQKTHETTQTNVQVEFVQEKAPHPIHRQSFMVRAGEIGETVSKALVSLVN
ncbi:MULTISPECIES: hypothetical protein [Pseudovibrio]|uniref:hypothetical protein n=1 Tax=Stappiaceae TaxID=2821832 RepID=UPI002366D915|nr:MULTISPECIES: hypothetical protein [Pseudovibrio]MDD7908448.1 hypothetical protein [Pseudovibrio exalbescens]MDX5592649.1 hypothetical protein [Pseudovibrio sp. SPO723]